MDLIALSQAKVYSDLLAYGFTDVVVDEANTSIIFTLKETGEKRTLKFPKPKDGDTAFYYGEEEPTDPNVRFWFKPGADPTGFLSPTAYVEETATGARIVITDINGTTEAEIKNGTGGGADIDDNVIATNKTWSSAKIDSYKSEFVGIDERVTKLEESVGNDAEFVRTNSRLPILKTYSTSGKKLRSDDGKVWAYSTSTSMHINVYAVEKGKVYDVVGYSTNSVIPSGIFSTTLLDKMAYDKTVSTAEVVKQFDNGDTSGTYTEMFCPEEDGYVYLMYSATNDTHGIWNYEEKKIVNNVARGSIGLNSAYDSLRNIISFKKDGNAQLNFEKAIKRNNVGYAGQLHIDSSNGKILNQHNEEFTIRSISLFHTPEMVDFFTVDLLHQLQYYGLNCVRIPIYLRDKTYHDNTVNYDLFCSGWGTNEDLGTPIDAETQAKRDIITNAIDKIVNICVQLKLYCILDFHAWHAHDGSAIDYKETGKAFFTFFADKYKNIPNLLYEVVNEPYSTIDITDNHELFIQYCKDARDIIHNYNSNAIVICGTLTTRVVQLAGEVENIALAPHFYTGQDYADLSKYDSFNNNHIPIIVTEFGNTDGDGITWQESYDDKFIEFLNKMDLYNFGRSAWKLSCRPNSNTSILVYSENAKKGLYKYGFLNEDLTHNGALVLDSYRDSLIKELS